MSNFIVMSNRELEFYFKKIKPVMRFFKLGENKFEINENGPLRFLLIEDCFHIFPTYTKVGNIAYRLKFLQKIETRHPFLGGSSLLQTTCEEVYKQIPANLINQISAFETKLTSEYIIKAGCYLKTTTVLYSKI